MAQSILKEYDQCTISYHVEAHKNLKKQVIFYNDLFEMNIWLRPQSWIYRAAMGFP
mgnify:CR=1 FL=1